MQTKFISKKKVAELQGMCDDYSRKTKSNIGFKIVAGLLVLGIPVITIIGCSKKKEEVSGQLSLFSDLGVLEVIEELKHIDISRITPIEALNKLYVLQEKVR